MGGIRLLAGLLAGLAWLALGGCGRGTGDEGDADLTLVIVVDQLRGDLPARFESRFGENGFRRLMDEGLWFRDAWYSTGPGKTCPGHASIATGATPAQHGIVANDWYDLEAGRTVYCAGDEGHAVLGEPTAADDGTSPQRLTASTFGDELVAASAGRSRVFAVAGKDRSAIMMAGHLGKAFWYSDGSARITSSDYYWAQLPDWLMRFNRENSGRFRTAVWKPASPRGDAGGPRDDRPWEVDKYGLGRAFPHDLGKVSDDDFPKALRYTPFLDELVVDAALELIRAEKLGRRGAPDVLAVGLSATDYIGHAWGPESLEAEEGLARLDGQLARLIAGAESAVGRDRLRVVLTADHGVANAPETMASLGYALGRVSADQLVMALEAHLGDRFGLDGAVAAVELPWVYLDERAIREAGVDLAVVEDASEAFLAARRGIHGVLLRREITRGAVPADPTMARLARAVHPRRSGHLALVPESGWYLHDTLHENAAMHGSPYGYDLHVPLFFMGPGIAAGEVVRRVYAEDVAPTLALVFGVAPPSASIGRPIAEVLGEPAAADPRREEGPAP